MDEKQMEKMIQAYDEMQLQRAWRNQQDYDRSFLLHLQTEQQTENPRLGVTLAIAKQHKRTGTGTLLLIVDIMIQ